MALTALEIYKNLPKTNCKECGFPTCLAFAMQIAQKKVELGKCPHVSEAGKAALEGASAPPIRLVTIGAGGKKLQIGQETVLFRHEETFHHPAGLAIEVSDALGDAELDAAIREVDALQFERVGTTIEIDLLALRHESGDPARFRQAAEKAKAGCRYPLVLMSEDPEALAQALEATKDDKPLVYAATHDNYEKVAALAKAAACPLAVRAEGPEELADLTQKVAALGVQDLVLDPGSASLAKGLADHTTIRRAALRKTYRALGYPTIAFAASGDPYQETAEAATYMAKYAGIVVMKGRERWQIMPVLTARYNIYTDPQKPIQVQPGVYAIGDVTPNSPVLLTTNFSLTYYTVAGDVENSRVPSYIVVADTEGTSVLTAYASEKLTADRVAAMLTEDGGIKDKVSHKKIIIPGLIAVMTAKLKDNSGWDVVVGPKESAGIPKLLRAWSA
ncbi:MAG: acetyl-CoA decarbonylase/synthase complex subunit gamma [Armatimonadetes bacterium]|nr:acetyl-CoA decarbonylase/synthase complex subunit gamma [Armatimonadota bacterium]